MKAIWLRHRSALRRKSINALLFALLAPLFTLITVPTTYISSAEAATTTTKTWTVRGSNGLVYAGAQARIFYFDKGDVSEGKTSIVTSDANGQFTFTYPTDPDYLWLTVQVPTSDTTHAIFNRDLLSATDAASSAIQLEAATHKIKITQPDGTDPSASVCFNLPTSATNTDVLQNYRTLRTGVLGIKLPSTLATGKNYYLETYPCDPTDYHLQGNVFGIKKASDGTFTFYTDRTYSTAISATSGVFLLPFKTGKITGQLLKTDGSAFTVAENTTNYNIQVIPVLDNNDIDPNRNWSWGQMSINGKFMIYTEDLYLQTGKYVVSFSPYGTVEYPAFLGGNIWVDSTGKFSTTSGGTFTSTLSLNYTVPTTGLTKFKVLDAQGAVTSGGYFSVTRKRSDGSFEYWGELGLPKTGIASVRFVDGVYQVKGSPNNSQALGATYTYTVTSGVGVLKNAANQVISLSSGYYELATNTPNLNIKVVSPVDTSTVLKNISISIYPNDNSNNSDASAWIETTTSPASFAMANGSYDVEISPNDQDFTSNTFSVIFTGGVPVVKSGTETFTAISGIYYLPLRKPHMKGVVKSPDGSLVRYSNVAIYRGTEVNPIRYANTDSAGRFSVNLGPGENNGTYYLQALPQWGKTAFASSARVTAVVSAGQGPTNLELNLRTSNVIGTVSGPRGNSSYNQVRVEKFESGKWVRVEAVGIKGYSIQTTSDGGFGLFLEAGKYRFWADTDIENAGGTASYSSDCDVSSDATVLVTCNLVLSPPNVSGTVTVGGVQPNYINVGFIPSNSISNNTAKEQYWSNGSSDGYFGATVPAGLYRLWINYQNNKSGNSTVPGPLCEVPASGNITCNATLPANNFNFTISNYSSTLLTSGTYAGIQVKEGSNYLWTCCSNPDATGRFTASLLNGSYRIQVMSNKDGSSQGTAQNYIFDVETGTVTNLKLEGTTSTITPASGVYALQLKAPNMAGTLYAPDGVTPVPEVQLIARYANVNQNIKESFNTYWAYTDNLGKFAFDLGPNPLNGEYTIQALAPQGDLTKGNSDLFKVTVASGVGPSNLSIRLNSPNFKGTVTTPNGLFKNIGINLQKLDGSGNWQWVENGWNSTDAAGKYAYSLGLGSYRIFAEPDYGLTGAAGTYSPSCLVADTSTITTCDLTLSAPNTTGTFTINGVAPRNGYVRFIPAWGVTNNTAKNYYYSGFGNTGKFGANVEPGTYRMSIYYDTNAGSSTVTGPLCVVPSTGSIVCNVNLPATNFKFKLLNASGTDISSTGYVGLGLTSELKYMGSGCCTYYNSLTGQFEFSLLDGSYTLNTYSGGSNSSGIGQVYTFDVTNGVVSNLKIEGTNTVLNATAGVYTVSLRAPPFAGNVYKPDGTTPQPNAVVRVSKETPNGTNSWDAYTDKNGYFAVNLGATYLDGQYSLQSWSNDWSDTSTGKSAIRVETITAGVGPTNISLALRTPNLKGVVSGLKGVSANNWIQLFKRDTFENWNYVNEYRQTNLNGDFAFYLDSGVYRVRSGADMEGAGGGEGYSAACTVIVESATVTTCNIELPPPNASGTVTIGGAIVRPSNVQFSPDYGVENNLARNWYSSPVAANGSWGITAEKGTYRSNIYSYIQGVNSTVPGPQCVVPETGTVTCNFALPATNLTFKVKDTSGNFLTNGIYGQLEIKSGSQWIYGGNLSPDNAVNSGRFTASLINGEYQLTAYPSNSGNQGASNIYLFEVETGTVKNLRVSRTGETLTASAGVYELSLKQPAFSGTVYGTDGTTPIADAEVSAQLVVTPANVEAIKRNGIPTSWSASTNSAGQFMIDFGGRAVDGVYKLQAIARTNTLTLGSSLTESITVTSGIGSNTIRLNLRAPNVSGVVSGIKGVSPSNWISVRKLLENGNYEYLQMWRTTDTLGRFAFTLDPGSYQFTAQSDIKNAGGTGTISEICTVQSSGSSVCNISLPPPNVSGKITVGGVSVSGSIEFIKVQPTGFEYSGLYAGTGADGVFAITAPSGSYRTRVYIYDKGTWFFGPLCEVPSSGSVTCDAALPASNLTIKILDKDSNVLSSGVSVYLEAIYSNGRLGSCCSQPGKEPSNPTIKYGLLDGNYRMSINPNEIKFGSSASYLVEIETGTVKSIKREGFDSSLSATDGVYSLALAAPVISGTVVAPDGTTPVPNTDVDAYFNGKTCMWCQQAYAYSDNSGYYGFTQLPDGTYQIVARAPWTDSTKGDSAPTTVTVSGGLGAANVKLTLQTPTVRGVVRGPLGISPYNYIYVREISSQGYDFWPDYVRNKPSSGDGSFAFALPPGTYQFEAQGDLQNAGGVSTRSSNCVVTDTSTVINCDINLSAPNLKIRVVKPDGTNFTNIYDSYAYVWFNGGSSSVKNYSPQFSRDNDGNMSANLEDGTWTLMTEPSGAESSFSSKRYQVVVAGGVVTSVSGINGESVTVVSGVYQLPVTGANLTGTITLNGTKYINGSYVQVQQKIGDRFEWRDGRWSNGDFGFKFDPGTYRIYVQPYGTRSTEVAATYSGECVIQETATTATVCNVVLRTPNLLGRIKTPAGDDYRFVDAYLRVQEGQKGSSSTYVRVEDSKFGSYLETSTTYLLEINPYWDQRKEYAPRSYEIVTGASGITSVRDLTANETLTAVDGYYTFKVSSSSLKGIVLPPGTGTIGVRDVQIAVSLPGSSDQWRYSTSTDQDGRFGLLVPDGTYVIRAIPYGGLYQYGKSETQTVVITGGTTASPITIRLRAPNLTGRVVTPGASPVPLANVNVNVWLDGEYFYGWTDSSGQFGFYVDNTTPTCTKGCQIQLNYYKSSDYTPKSYSVTSVTNLGDLAIGGITSRVTVLVPQTGSATTANRYGWISVESVDSATSNTSYVTGGQTDDLGKVGLSLTDGVRYKITAYPGYDFNGKFAPKVYEISSYSAASMSQFTIQFDRPNLYVSSFGSTGGANSYGWTRVTKYESSTSTYNFYSNIYLDEKGEAAYTLPDGTYQITIRPGKTVGTQRTITVVIASGVASCSAGCAAFASSKATVNLPNGNISGKVVDSTGAALKGALIVATRVDDTSKNVTAVTSASGIYEIYLDTSYDWTLGSVDPASGERGSTSLSATPGTSDSVVTDKNITLAP
ncbi:Carboxypeptidase regulatory-like domain containing protein [Candidatus Nanopelagicaceae bacterium]